MFRVGSKPRWFGNKLEKKIKKATKNSYKLKLPYHIDNAYVTNTGALEQKLVDKTGELDLFVLDETKKSQVCLFSPKNNLDKLYLYFEI